MSNKEFGKGFQSVKETPSVVSVSSIIGGGYVPIRLFKFSVMQ